MTLVLRPVYPTSHARGLVLAHNTVFQLGFLPVAPPELHLPNILLKPRLEYATSLLSAPPGAHLGHPHPGPPPLLSPLFRATPGFSSWCKPYDLSLCLLISNLLLGIVFSEFPFLLLCLPGELRSSPNLARRPCSPCWSGPPAILNCMASLSPLSGSPWHHSVIFYGENWTGFFYLQIPR